MFANLTLYTDINYNLYVPVEGASDYIEAINGKTLAELEPVKNEAGVEYYWLTFERAAHNANEAIEIGFKPVNSGKASYTLKKTLSVADYIERVYNNAGLNSSYTLMSDLVDYVVVTMNYVGTDATAFTELQSNAKYHSSETPDSLTSNANGYSDLTGYIAGAHINVAGPEAKVVLTVGTATEVTWSYTSANGKTETDTVSTTEGKQIEISMRAYDLNAVISISVNGGAATGEYDLATYANSVKETDTDAYALLLEMYNYAVSAKNYKFPADVENN